MAAGRAHVRLAGKAALVTGGSRGLGLAIAGRFCAEGAHVAICGRSEEALGEASAALRSACVDPGQEVLADVADVADCADVERFVAATLERFGRIDVAVCNAGVQGPVGFLEETDWEEWARAVQVNLFGTVLTCRCVVPVMRRQGAGKIVALSGGGATAPRPRFSAYAASKAAVVRFVETLAAELEGTSIDVNAVAPGALNTRMLDALLAAGPEAAGAEVHAGALRQRDDGGSPFDVATDLIAFLASDESNGISGRLIAARWDDWRRLRELRERLAGSDVFTLRRIVPEDRGWPRG
ncbi:MAG TPA: SDR family oxidoreductase [Chloroflexota bacterium]|nr:SDR family oxidoreductase [Chloroflexota bacterium]